MYASKDAEKQQGVAKKRQGSGAPLRENLLCLLTGWSISDTMLITAAVINEFIAVIAAKKGFELAGEIERPARRPV